MLGDAVRAEIYRLMRNRATLFWSALFVPLAAFLLTIGAAWLMRGNEAILAEAGAQVGITPSALNLGESLVDNTAGLAGGPLLLFVLIGAATVFAGDYRWETWRLIRPRNRRANLILGKVAATALLILMAMIAMLVASMAAEPIRAAILNRGVAFSMDGQGMLAILGLFGLGALRILQMMMISLFAAVLTRSMMAALFIPLVVAAAQAIGAPVLTAFGVEPDSWTYILALPGQAFDALKTVLIGPGQISPALSLKAGTALALWTVLPLAAALALFERQDLSKE